MNIICILMFFCSSVLVYNVTLSQESSQGVSAVLSWVLHSNRGEIPGPGQG